MSIYILGGSPKPQAPVLLSGDNVLPEQFQTSLAKEENTCKTGLSSGFKVKGTEGFPVQEVFPGSERRARGVPRRGL